MNVSKNGRFSVMPSGSRKPAHAVGGEFVPCQVGRARQQGRVEQPRGRQVGSRLATLGGTGHVAVTGRPVIVCHVLFPRHRRRGCNPSEGGGSSLKFSIVVSVGFLTLYNYVRVFVYPGWVEKISSPVGLCVTFIHKRLKYSLCEKYDCVINNNMGLQNTNFS